VYGDPLVHIPKVAERIGADLIVVGYPNRSRFA
jgi:nucleotide-binding universal stress UspA family protein